MVMGFLFSLFGCSKKGDDGNGPNHYVAEQAYKDNLAKQLSMTPQTVAQLRKHGVAQNSTLRLEFFFYTDTEPKAESLAEALKAMGCQAEVGPSAGDDKLFLVNGWTTPLKMDDPTVLDWTRQMCNLGYEHDCEFDGWGTNPGVVVEPSWQANRPDGWEVKRDDDCITLHRHDGHGALQISTAFKDASVTTEDLHDYASRHIEAGAKTRDLTCGDFVGFTLAFGENDIYWRHWYLRHGNQMLFITYNCSIDDRGKEDAAVAQILHSLRDRQSTK